MCPGTTAAPVYQLKSREGELAKKPISAAFIPICLLYGQLALVFPTLGHRILQNGRDCRVMLRDDC